MKQKRFSKLTSALASLVDISKGIMSSATGLNIFVAIARVHKYKWIFQKKKLKCNAITLLAKANLHSKKV